MVVHKIHYSPENFHGASGHGHHVLYIASDSRGKLSRLAKKLEKKQKFSHSKVLPYTVYIILILLYFAWADQRVQPFDNYHIV